MGLGFRGAVDDMNPGVPLKGSIRVPLGVPSQRVPG